MALFYNDLSPAHVGKCHAAKNTDPPGRDRQLQERCRYSRGQSCNRLSARINNNNKVKVKVEVLATALLTS